MALDGKITRKDISRARKDLGFFARLVGWPLADFQLESLLLETLQTILIAARQAGKSRSMAVLGAWWAFRRSNQLVLVVSAGQTGADRLLATIADITGSPLLHDSVDEEYITRIVLDNGSEIRAFPASQKQVRGWSANLVLIDEASLLTAEMWAAILPTTAARGDARIVLASSPFGDSGVFYELAMAGQDPENPVTRTFRWSLSQAPWITAEHVEAARQTLPKAQFEAEYLGKWVSAGSFFDRDDLMACIGDFPMVRDGAGAPGIMGLDWGRKRDRHAIAVAGLMDDYGRNGRSVIIVSYVSTSKVGYDDQLAEIGDIAKRWSLTTIRSEVNGPGQPVTDQLRNQVSAPVTEVFSSQRDKAAAYAEVAMRLEQRTLVLPDWGELIKQFLGITQTPTPGGGLHIKARTESIHDDICDAICLAVAGLAGALPGVPVREAPAGIRWIETPGGIHVPVPVITRRAELSYGELNGELHACGRCGFRVRVAAPECKYCHEPNPQFTAPAPKPEPLPAAVVAAAAAVPAGNRNNLDLWRCPAGHLFDHRFSDQCPTCHGGGRMRPGGQGPGGGLPPHLWGRLGPFLGPGR